MCVPLTIAVESYAQMFMIINKIHISIVKNKLRKSFDILVNSTASVFSGLNLANRCLSQLDSTIRP